MEKRAYHLHKAPGKNFWQFFLDFIMLFVAVFCGFLAENFREHQAENAKGKQYIASLIEDLAADTTNLTAVIKEYDENDLKIDTLLNMFGKLTLGYNDTLYRNFSAILRYPDFIYTDRTMQQLKNSGGMQFIRNKAVSDGIMDYDAKVRDCEIDEGSIDQIHSRIRMLWYELIDTENMELDKNVISISKMEKGTKNYLLVSDKATIGKFNNMVRDYKSISILVKNQEIKLRTKAIQLIALLKEEYHLD